METKLERIAEIAKSKPNEKFTSLIHLINKETLVLKKYFNASAVINLEFGYK